MLKDGGFMKVILASTNPGKIAEFKAFLSQYGIDVVSLSDIGYEQEIVEDGNSFFENALIKAKTIFEYTGLPVISDDSGLCCRGLNDEPGIFSARYHGLKDDIERRRFIVKELENNPNKDAYFHCSIVFYVAKNTYHHFVGECFGTIIPERGEMGFGYDPIFLMPNGLTLAEISREEKNKVSHRGIAMQKFKELLDNDFSNK